MKVLVTGGSGFTGSHIVLELAKNAEDEVLIFDPNQPNFEIPMNVRYVAGDVFYKGGLDHALRGVQEVYHCSGLLGTSELISQSERAVDINIKGTLNVLQSCLDQGVQRVFYPTKGQFSRGWENTYTITKIAAENFARMYRDIYGMDVTILRWMNVSGPRQHIYPIRKFVPLAICLALVGRDIEIYGDGNQTVDIVDVRDAAAIAIKAVRSGMGRHDKVWDVGTGQPISCNDVARYIIRKMSSSSQIVHRPMRLGESMGTNLYAKNHLELLNLIGYRLQYDPYQTIDDCIEHYRGLEEGEVRSAVQYFFSQPVKKEIELV